MSISQSAAAEKRALEINTASEVYPPLAEDLEGLYIKQAIQGLFTAGTSPERKRSVANGD